MKLSRLLLPAAGILAYATAFADGGTVQFRQEAGDLAITVFSTPSPLSVGRADISILLQKRDGLEPVLDAEVSLLLRTDGPESGLQARASREEARNKLLYATSVIFPKPGKWQVAVKVERLAGKTTAEGILNVAPAPGTAGSYLAFIVFPMGMSLFVMVREVLIRRKLERK